MNTKGLKKFGKWKYPRASGNLLHLLSVKFEQPEIITLCLFVLCLCNKNLKLGMVVKWFPLLPHSKKVLGLKVWLTKAFPCKG